MFESKSNKYTSRWSPDGRYLAFSNMSGPQTGLDLWILPLTGDRKPFVFLATPASEDHPEFSPDGHWIAYSSKAFGREEVYVRPFPGPGGQYQVSRSGGMQPQWRGNRGELLFLALDGTLMATSVAAAPNGFGAGVPEPLFQTGVALSANTGRHQYSVAKDGKRFLINVPDRGVARSPITVALNWPATVGH